MNVVGDRCMSECAKNFSEISFYIPENEKRYINYAKLNPQMDKEDVVWQVNNYLDKEKYSFDVAVTDFDDPCLIVNKFFKLPLDYVPNDLIEADGIPMCKKVAIAYIKMRDAAKEEGFSIKVTSAYRSAKIQQETYERFLKELTPKEVDESVARPGYSEHQTGLAVDIEGSIPGGRNIHKTPEAKWLKDNCHKFGFILRYLPETTFITGYASEPWHFRYVGVDISADVHNKGIKTLEEYVQRYRNRSK